VNKKSLLSAFLTAILIGGSILASAMRFETVQASTDVIGIITSDTTWTKANSPYSLTGPTAIGEGVTLTIEAGATVNLNEYYIQVNGTLIARGTDNDKIYFNDGSVIFTSVSNGWNEQTQAGCLIENAVISQTSISSSNRTKIYGSIINAEISVTSSIISNNIVNGDISSHSSVISNNNVKGNIVLGAVSLGAISAPAESSTVSGNTVEGSITSGSPQGTPVISDNTVSKGGIGCTGYGSIINNYVHDCQEGISLFTMRVFGGNLPCYAIVENNLVVDNTKGVSIELTDVHGGGSHCPTIQKNTISGNSIGIYLSELGYDATPTIQNNNLQNNSNYSFYLDAPNNVDAGYNWWGTTNESAISQSIYDFKNDFNLGTVSFQPILTSPNSNAPAPPTPTPLPAITPTPTPPNMGPTSPPNHEPLLTPEQLGIIVGVAIVVAVLGAGLGLLFYFKKRKH
jgi:parallel beta-helix repeat protein